MALEVIDMVKDGVSTDEKMMMKPVTFAEILTGMMKNGTGIGTDDEMINSHSYYDTTTT